MNKYEKEEQSVTLSSNCIIPSNREGGGQWLRKPIWKAEAMMMIRNKRQILSRWWFRTIGGAARADKRVIAGSCNRVRWMHQFTYAIPKYSFSYFAQFSCKLDCDTLLKNYIQRMHFQMWNLSEIWPINCSPRPIVVPVVNLHRGGIQFKYLGVINTGLQAFCCFRWLSKGFCLA